MGTIAHYELNGVIDDDQLRNLLCFIQNDLSESSSLLEVRICSHGGSVSIGLAMAELLREVSIRIRTVNMSNVDSSAIMVYASGDDRMCYSHSGFFIHEVGKECCGTKTIRELQHMIEEIKFDTDRIVSFLSDRTGRPSVLWRKYMNEGVVLSAVDAQELGLVTGIISHA